MNSQEHNFPNDPQVTYWTAPPQPAPEEAPTEAVEATEATEVTEAAPTEELLDESDVDDTAPAEDQE